MGDRGAFAWTADETALLVRAWAAAAAESAPRSATARAVYAHFQRLAVGGESGRAEKAVQARRALLHNMYGVIRTHDAHVAAAAASGAALNSSDQNVAVGEAEGEGEVLPVLLHPWFQLPEHERRRRFAELNKRSWTLFTDLTEEQCASIAALKALASSSGGGGSGGAIPSDASDAEGGGGSGDESHLVAARVAKWDADETTRLLLAWQQVTEANAPKRATAKEIFQHFEKLSANGSSGRAEVSVVQRYTILRNIHTVIQTYDARVLADATTTTQPTELPTLTDDTTVDSEVVAPPSTLSPPPPRLWFSLGESERRRGFAELNTRKWLQYATITERQFEAVSFIKDLTAATVLPVAPTPVPTLSLVDPTLPSASPPDVSVSTETGTATDRTTAEFAAKMHRWCSDDTTLLVRAWTEVAEANAHRKVTAKEVARRFEELSEGGSSGRSLTAIPQKHTILRNMFTIICVYNERALAAGEECGDGRAARLWFALSKDERRRFFAEMNKKSWTHFVDLTEPQFDAITAIEKKFASVILDRAETAAAAADGSESPVALESAAVELSSSVPVVDVGVFKPESTTTSDTTSDNDRSSVVDVVLLSLSPPPPPPPPPIPPVPVQRAFWDYANTTQLLQAWAETRVVKQNPRPSSSEVAHHFQRTAMDDTKQTTESSIRLRHSMLHNLYSIICVYNDKVAAATATLATLATDGESETNGSLTLSLSPPLPWFSLPLDERRRVFNDMNAKTSCWFVDMPKEHFCFIEETLRQDVGAPPLAVGKLSPSPTREVVPVVVKPAPSPSPTSKNSGGKHSGGDGKRARMWTTEHTTVMLRAWEDVVSDPHAAKPTTGTLYTHFLTLTDGNGGAESSFIHRFRSMRFLHSIIVAYNSQPVATRVDNDDNHNNENKRDTGKDVVVDQTRSHDDGDSNDNNSWNKWFELPLGDRRRRFNDAGGKALLFVDLTREQFDTLSRILSTKSYPMPMITRRADTRDRSTTALGDHDTGVDGVKSNSKRARTRPATGEQQRSKQRRLLPAPSGVAGLGVGALATGRPMVKSARGTTVDSDVESAIAHASRQLSVVMERMRKNDGGGLRYHAATALSSPSSSDSSSSSSRPHVDANSDRSDSDDVDVDDYDWGSARIPRSSVGDSGDDNDNEDNDDSDSELQDASPHQLMTATGPHLPVPRGGAQSRLVAAAAMFQQQTETLSQLLRDTQETRARDAAERRYLVSCMRRDEKERQEAERVLRSRVDEIRRQRATWRDERDEMKRVYAELRE